MHRYLEEIIEYKKSILENLRNKTLPERKKAVLNPLNYLREKPFIMEIKKASPSKGVIDADIDVVKRAKDYERLNAGCISILTEDRFFKGSFNDLLAVSKNVEIPLLSKDFFIDECQLDIAYAYGADMVLLIVKILNGEKIERLYKKAKQLGLEVLFEVHTLWELNQIKDYKGIIGVNSRNLEDFTIDKLNAARLLNKIPRDCFKVAESGIMTADDVAFFKKAGADAFLVGSHLMSSNNLESSVLELYKGLK